MRFLTTLRQVALSEKEHLCFCQRIPFLQYSTRIVYDMTGLSNVVASPFTKHGRGKDVSLTLTHRRCFSEFTGNIQGSIQNASASGSTAAGRSNLDVARKQEEMDETSPQRKRQSTVFFDSLRLHVKGGVGGQGLLKKGGIGGKGGDIVAVGHKNATLKSTRTMSQRKRFAAAAGNDSKFFCLNGTPGKNLVIPVPVGVSIITEFGHKIGEINNHGDRLIIAKGGNGACSANGFSAEQGQCHHVTLDLKLIADVGFVGFPNAGKSTLLKAISKASPKIASYPFTTIRPNVGIIEYSDYRRISLADLPGLIEGAHANIGMGHAFLKHVERTKVLLFVVDIHGFQLGPKFPHRTALETIVLLNKELELYKEELTEKPAILALNKSDLPGSYHKIKEISNTVSDQRLYEKYLMSLPPEIVPENVLLFDKILPMSAKTDPFSVNELKNTIREVIDSNASQCEIALS